VRNYRIILLAILLLAWQSPVGASFDLDNYFARYYFITASSSKGGKIDPSGLVIVRSGRDKTFRIAADKNYVISDVLVDGESVGAVEKYKFNDVESDHTIEALFVLKTYTITPTTDGNGSTEPSEPTLVNHDSDQEFKINPNSGFEIEDVLVDGESLGPLASYTFKKVKADHSIHATFFSIFQVENVSIPNKSMKIGDVVDVTINVEENPGDPYTFVSGTVGGYPLENFQRISATTYGAEFTIIQDGNSYTAEEDIPVSELVISNGADLSAPYNLPIVQDSDPLDAALPLIYSLLVEGGAKKVGDVINLVIETDGENYSIDPLSSINGIAVSEPNVAFSESGSGTYVLSYTVMEGDTDVGPEAAEFLVSVILIKPSENTSLPYTTVTNASSLSIDANSPVILRLEVPDEVAGAGDTVRLSISADDSGYICGSETEINGVPLSSPRVSLHELQDGLYELFYVVGIEDPSVSPGLLQASISLIDETGNVGPSYSDIDPNLLEIYTTLPGAVLIGPPEICEGEEAQLTVLLSGRSPWSFEFSDGSNTTSYTNISTEESFILVSPVETTTYQVFSLRDVNGVENPEVAEFQINVIEATDVEIINLAPGYNVEADPVELEANISGGVFSGPGVVSSTGIFYPYVADTLNSPHTIYYTYTNNNGCISMDSALVYVVGANGDILIPDNKFCSNDEPFTATVFKNSGESGTFTLLDADSEPVEGLTDNGDNTAVINPRLLNEGVYTIEYQYYDGATLYLRRSFSVDAIVQPEILPLDETVFCQDAAPVELLASVAEAFFQGPGISGNVIEGFLFNPRAAEPGLHVITCSITSQNGCTASDTAILEVLFSPEVGFEITTECLPDGGEIVSFHNLCSQPEQIESWSWDFGDPGSGEDNYSSLKDPSHYYQEQGLKTISLTANTYGGCVASFELETIIDSRPVADFTWISDCYSSASGVKFVNLSSHGSATPDSIVWTFRNSEGDPLGSIASETFMDTVVYQFDAAERYLVDLLTVNKGGCSDEISKEILLRPSLNPDNLAYQEHFDLNDGQWTVDSEDQVESWVWGEADFSGYIPENGEKAWYTHLPSGESAYEENSWIQSPCYDFTDFSQPLIQMDIMRSFYPYFSGAVLQYRDVIEEGWLTIGDSRPGINWYNFDNIASQPGGSYLGWGSEEFTPETEWVTAVHDLDQLAGKSNVVLRIAFGSIGRMSKGNQGFALNSLQVAERSKVAVLEHFTNYTDFASKLADNIVDSLGIKHSRELIDLQYHMAYPESDPMNTNNPDPPSTRSFIYGVSQVPYTVMNGGLHSYHRYSYSELVNSPLEDQLALLTLEIPAFEIDLSVDWQNFSLEASTTVTCVADRFDENIQLYLVVFESMVSNYEGPNGDAQFRNVVLDMLPTPAGKLLGNNWRKGYSDTRINTWDYQLYVEHLDELGVAAFIQDRTTGQILQAAVDYKDQTVGIDKPKQKKQDLRIYPNPTQNTLYVNLGEKSAPGGKLEISDVNGRLVFSEKLNPGSELIQLGIGQLQPGIYILQWIESGQSKSMAKIVKTR